MSINSIDSNVTSLQQIHNSYTGTTENTESTGNNETHQQQDGRLATNSEENFISMIEKANRLTSGSTECQFSIHKQTNQIIIKLINPTTKEVIKEIPSEKILDMVANMCELAGLFVDAKR